jgi:hypothetical protein
MTKQQREFLTRIDGKQLFSLKDKFELKKFSKICELWLKIRQEAIDNVLSEM